MKTELLKNENGVSEFSVTLEKEAWDDARDKALKKLAKNVELKGFRKGQVPFEMAKKYVDQTKLLDEAINSSLSAMYNAGLNELKIQPFVSPDVEVTNITNDLLEVKFTVTVYPEVTLGKYKDIHLEKPVAKVVAKDVNTRIEKLLEDNADLVLTNEPAKLGDTVVLDFKGYMDGKEFDGGSADNYSLVLGSNSFIPGFEDQLVGVTSESKKDINVTFPEQYVKDLAGKDAKFVCMIHEIKTKVKPELNDEFVATLEKENVKTVDDLKKSVKADLLKEKQDAIENDYLNKLIDVIAKDSKVIIGEKVLEERAKDELENTKHQIEQNGLTYEQYLEILGLTEEKLLENIKSNVSRELVPSLVLNKIAEVEHLFVTRQELDAFYESTAKAYGADLEEFKKAYASQENQIASSLVQRKIITFLQANNSPLEPVKEEKPATKKVAKKPAKKVEEPKEEK